MPRKPRHLLWSEEARFLELCNRYRERFSLKIYYYCLMDNHFHLLAQLQDARQLSSMAAGLLRSYVRYFNCRYGFVGHLWQGRFKSPAIQKETYLLSCGRYIERNPLAAGIFAEPWDYEWSSCRAYALGEPGLLLAENSYYLDLS